jgi:hypothetical protein
MDDTNTKRIFALAAPEIRRLALARCFSAARAAFADEFNKCSAEELQAFLLLPVFADGIEKPLAQGATFTQDNEQITMKRPS